MKPTVLIVDDDEEIRSQLKWALAADYELVMAGDCEEALAAFARHRPSVTLLDLGLPPRPADPDEGFATLTELLAPDRAAKVVMVTGQGDKSNALRAVGEGAYDFLCKPVDIDELKVILKRACHVAQLEREYRELQQAVNQDGFEGMIGSSARMQTVFNAIRRVAGTGASVLILGESGTGKEVAARAIHRKSGRREGPFVPINCGAIPETLLESELFGHEKGSFTGAHMQRWGRIESASGGTLFLDEIGELTPPLQVKLLRFLQEQTIERVGGRVSIPVDARVIAATNTDLKKAMAQDTFREDLYYRLAVVTIELPPLRDRSEDIAVLAKSFVRRFASDNGRPSLNFSKSALKALENHMWPGNVRELENRIKRGVIMAEGRQLSPADLELGGATSQAKTLKDAREIAEREVVYAALRKCRWKIAPAAVELDISRPTLYELMEKLGIEKPTVPTESHQPTAEPHPRPRYTFQPPFAADSNGAHPA
jgi:two-component system NtrC family response regulator